MNSSQGPVFVTGTSSTGKTLLSLLIASHPSLAIPRQETHFWKSFYCRYGNLSKRPNLERCLAAMVLEVEARGFRHRADWIRERFAQGEPSYGRLFAAFMEDYAEQSSKPRWGCHTQQLEEYADAIFGCFPQARVIQMVRDPRDRYAAKFLREPRPRKSPGQLGLETSIWLRSLSGAESSQGRFPGRWSVVSYEALVLRPEQTLTSVFAFLEETPIPVSLALAGLPRERDELGRRPYGALSSTGVGCYQRLLSARDIAFIQLLAGAKMSHYGYGLEAVPLSVLDRLALYGADHSFGLLRRLLSGARRALSSGRRARGCA